MARARHWLAMAAATTLAIGVACGSDDDGDGGGAGGTGQSPEQTGEACEVAAECFPEVDHSALAGEVVCIDRVENGYCTHTCEQDADCCAVEGECDTDLLQVCSPFESMEGMHCFLSCEDEDLRPAEDGGAGEVDPDEFCQREAHPDFICRSSGGGSDNRRICVPGDLCGDPALYAAYPDCVSAADEAGCTAAGGQWLAGACNCPTGEEDCVCDQALDCLAPCVAPVPETGTCADLSEGHCSATTALDGCWCVFNNDGVAAEQCSN
jgi:hypothetical protein